MCEFISQVLLVVIITYQREGFMECSFFLALEAEAKVRQQLLSPFGMEGCKFFCSRA